MGVTVQHWESTSDHYKFLEELGIKHETLTRLQCQAVVQHGNWIQI